MFCKSAWIFLSLFAFNQVLADCDNQACSTKDYSPELYARQEQMQAPILVFISFSMPEQSLKLWAEQASCIKAPLVIRGFVENSIQQTTQKAFELFGSDGMPELLVDPEAFERFNIQTVPAVVAVSHTHSPANDQAETLTESPFEVVYGDTSLEDALTLMLSRGSVAIQKVVKPLLEILRDADD